MLSVERNVTRRSEGKWCSFQKVGKFGYVFKRKCSPHYPASIGKQTSAFVEIYSTHTSTASNAMWNSPNASWRQRMRAMASRGLLIAEGDRTSSLASTAGK